MLEEKCKLLNEEYLEKCSDLSQYSEYENTLFSIFRKLYEDDTISYSGAEVKMKHYPPDYDPKSGFYHLICENYQHTGDETDRKPNLKRCERIRWAKEFIEYCAENCEKVWVWENERHNKKNILIFCPENDYLVVLSKRKEYFLLTTAYVVEYEHKRYDLVAEYQRFKTNNASKK